MAAIETRMILTNIVNGFIVLALTIFSIYMAILLLKLARRGIKALDIYIDSKK